MNVLSCLWFCVFDDQKFLLATDLGCLEIGVFGLNISFRGSFLEWQLVWRALGSFVEDSMRQKHQKGISDR